MAAEDLPALQALEEAYATYDRIIFMNQKKTTPWDLFNKSLPRASEELYAKRLDICMSCDKLIKITKQCKMCGCFMAQKTKLAHASCPLGKWSTAQMETNNAN